MTDPRKPAALETRDQTSDGRRASPSVARNRDAIRDVLAGLLPSPGHVLEIASGTGEHGLHVTAALPGLRWTFSDPDGEARASISAWIAHAGGSDRRLGPLDLRTDRKTWSDALQGETFDAVFCANMIHIAPWTATVGLIAGAATCLAPGGQLILYGPFARGGVMAPSNVRFSEDLKRRDPAWGVRDLDREIMPLAADHGLSLDRTIAMPANNLTVVLTRNGSRDAAASDRA